MGGRFGAVCRAERIIGVDVTQSRHLSGKFVIVFLLALIDAAVFQKHQIARRDIHAFDPVCQQWNVSLHQFSHALGDWRQRILRLEFAFHRSAEVRGHHDGGTLIERKLNRRDRGANSGVVGDVARIVLRHIQIGANENALVLQVKVSQADKCHCLSIPEYGFGNKLVVGEARIHLPPRCEQQIGTLLDLFRGRVARLPGLFLEHPKCLHGGRH